MNGLLVQTQALGQGLGFLFHFVLSCRQSKDRVSKMRSAFRHHGYLMFEMTLVVKFVKLGGG